MIFFFFNYSQKTPVEWKLNFSRSALFHIKTKLCLKHMSMISKNKYNKYKLGLSMTGIGCYQATLSMTGIGCTKQHLV